MFTWFKNLNKLRIKLLYVAKHYDELVTRMGELHSSHIRVENHVNDAVQTIRDRTTWHADIKSGRRDPHQIIMIGNYRGNDYIEVFSVPADDFRSMVNHCKDVNRFARRGVIDAAPDMKYILDKETKWW